MQVMVNWRRSVALVGTVLKYLALTMLVPLLVAVVYLVERQTGKRVLAFWDYDLFDSDEFRFEDDWPEVQTSEECSTCGWRRDL